MTTDHRIEDEPRTIRQLRESWAQIYTERNQLERELADTREALQLSRNALDALTDHCAAQGAYIARLQDAQGVAK